LRLTLAVLLAVVTAVLASGCGSGSGKPELTPRDRFVQRADAFCAAQARDFRRIKPLSTAAGRDLASIAPAPSSFKELGRFTNDVQRISRKNLKKFEKLPRPKGDKLVQQWTTAYLDTLKALQLYHTAAEGKNVIVLQQAEERNQKAQARYRRLSQQLGFKVCGGSV
jgi:hypothetical protein